MTRIVDTAIAQEREIMPSSRFSWEKVILAIFVLGTSAAVTLILIASNGNVIAGWAFLAVLTVVIITAYRLDFGFSLFIGAVLMFDQYYIPGFDPLTFKISYFRNLKEIPFLPSIEAAVLNPLELHLLLLLVVWVTVLCLRKDIKTVHVRVWGALLAFYVGIIGSAAYGLQRGGELLVALWEVRALIYCGILYCLVPQIIQTKEQLRLVMWTCIVAISFKAFQGLLRFGTLGFSLQGFATFTNHEDPLFMLTLIMLLFGLVMFKVQDPQKGALISLLLLLLMGFFVAQRRAAYAAILPSFAVFVAMLAAKDRVALFKAFVPVLLVLGVYATVFWDSESRFGSPVRLVKSGISTEPETAGERYYSNLYRELEKINLAKTVQLHPVFGIGFGNKYEMPIPLAKIDFPLRDYIPHNQILWVIVKTGVVGFFLFWFFLNAVAFRVGFLFQHLKDPYFKAVISMIVAAAAGQMVVSYFDMQLTYYRNMVYLGLLMGLVPAIERMNASLPIAQTKKEPVYDTPFPW